MGLMSIIANSRAGRTAALAMGAVAVPTYDMLHTAPVYAEPPVAPALDQRTQKLLADVELLEHSGLSDNELLDLYNRFLPKAVEFQKRLQNELRNHATNRGLNIDEIAEKDYDQIARPIEEVMNKNPIIQTVYDLGLMQKIKLAVLLGKYLDAGKVKRENAEFYPKGQMPYQKFLDAELTIPVEEKEFIHPVIVSKPRTYRTQSGQVAIEIGSDDGGLWANLRDFGPQPGPYAISRIEKELVQLRKTMFGLSAFMYGAANSSMTTPELENILKTAPEEVKDAIINAFGWEGGPGLDFVKPTRLDLTYSNLQVRERELRNIISDLIKTLGRK